MKKMVDIQNISCYLFILVLLNFGPVTLHRICNLVYKKVVSCRKRCGMIVHEPSKTFKLHTSSCCPKAFNKGHIFTPYGKL